MQRCAKIDSDIHECNKMESPFNDDRLEQLHEMTTVLKLLNRELNEIIFKKCDALLGVTLSTDKEAIQEDTKDMSAGAGWVEETIREIRSGIEYCRSSLDRMSDV